MLLAIKFSFETEKQCNTKYCELLELHYKYVFESTIYDLSNMPV